MATEPVKVTYFSDLLCIWAHVAEACLQQLRDKFAENVGYRVIEANINELIRQPTAGAASWC